MKEERREILKPKYQKTNYHSLSTPVGEAKTKGMLKMDSIKIL